MLSFLHHANYEEYESASNMLDMDLVTDLSSDANSPNGRNGPPGDNVTGMMMAATMKQLVMGMYSQANHGFDNTHSLTLTHSLTHSLTSLTHLVLFHSPSLTRSLTHSHHSFSSHSLTHSHHSLI